MKDKLMWQAAAVLLGGFTAVHCKYEVRIWVLAFFILLLCRLRLLWEPKDFCGRLYKPEIFLLACSMIIGYFYGMTADKALAPPLVIQEITLEGELGEWTITENTGSGFFIVEDTGNNKIYPLGRKYAIRVYADGAGHLPPGWESGTPGDRIRVTGKLEHPKPPGTAGEFDLPLYNAVRGLSGTVTAKGEVIVLEKGVPGIPWKIRTHIRNILDTYWPAQAPVLEGILFGDSSRIPAQTLDRYKAAGVMHVFAASGANVAFVVALFWGLFCFLPSKVRILATIGAIVLYAVLCQGNPPILRASVLGIAVLLGKLGRGRMSALRWLLLAALLLFAFKPLYLRDISFQLSFAATWGMVALTPLLQNSRWMAKLPQPLGLSAAVSFGAQLAALPVLIAVFHRVSLVGFITNVFMLFILGAVLQLGLIGTILAALPLVPLVFFQAAFWLLLVSDMLLSKLAAWPLAYFWVLNPGTFFWIIWYGALGIQLSGRDKVWFIATVQWRRLKRVLRLLPGMGKLQTDQGADKSQQRNCLDMMIGKLDAKGGFNNLKRLAIVASFLLILLAPWPSRDSLLITFLDVGQGDCILIQTSQENILVDTGPVTENFNAGERIVVPYLMEKRIGRLDMVFITHEDRDHIGGANYLLTNIPTEKVGVPAVGDRLLDDDWQEGIPEKYFTEDGKLILLRAGDVLTFPSRLTVEVLAPVGVITGTEADANNNSLVLLLHFAEKRILLTGDMEKEEMQQIAERGATWEADFLKVPHHGGKGSLDQDWFDRTSPLAVFISVGRNSFGHPSAEVMAYWQERGVPVFRTDLQGTIELEIDSKGYRIVPGRS